MASPRRPGLALQGPRLLARPRPAARAGRFDGIFIADVLGVYDVYGGSRDAAVRHAAQVPVGDPLLTVPAMAAVTEHLGFGITASTVLRAPLPLRAPDVDARPPHEGARRLERRHLLPRERRAQHRADEPRVATTSATTSPTSTSRSASSSGRAPGRTTPSSSTAAGVYADPARVHADRARGPWFQVPGRRTSPSRRRSARRSCTRRARRHAAALRRRARRGDLHERPDDRDHRAARRRDPRGARGRGPRARRRPRLHDGDGRRRRDLARRVGQARRVCAPTAPTRRRSSCSRAGRAWTSPATTSTPR